MQSGPSYGKSRRTWYVIRLAAILSLAACSAEPKGLRGSVYVASGATDRVFELDAVDGSLRDTLEVDLRPAELDEPHGLAVSRSGQHLYVVLAHGSPTLWKFELPSNRLVGRLDLGGSGAARIGITADDRRAFIPDYYLSGRGETSQVMVVDLVSLRVDARLALCPAPHHAAPDPSGRLVAVTCSLSDEIVLLDAESMEEVGRFRVGSSRDAAHVWDGRGEPAGRAGPREKPLNLVWGPQYADGGVVIVAMSRSGRLESYTPGGELIADADLGTQPGHLTVLSRGELAVVLRGEGALSIRNPVDLRERARVQLHVTNPRAVVSDPRGHRVYVGFEGGTEGGGGVVALSTETREILWTKYAGVYGLGLAFAPPSRE